MMRHKNRDMRFCCVSIAIYWWVYFPPTEKPRNCFSTRYIWLQLFLSLFASVLSLEMAVESPKCFAAAAVDAPKSEKLKITTHTHQIIARSDSVIQRNSLCLLARMFGATFIITFAEFFRPCYCGCCCCCYLFCSFRLLA